MTSKESIDRYIFLAKEKKTLYLEKKRNIAKSQEYKRQVALYKSLIDSIDPHIKKIDIMIGEYHGEQNGIKSMMNKDDYEEAIKFIQEKGLDKVKDV